MTPASVIADLLKLRSTFHLLDGIAGIADVWAKLSMT
jgi:hypothetical protein